VDPHNFPPPRTPFSFLSRPRRQGYTTTTASRGGEPRPPTWEPVLAWAAGAMSSDTAGHAHLWRPRTLPTGSLLAPEMQKQRLQTPEHSRPAPAAGRILLVGESHLAVLEWPQTAAVPRAIEAVCGVSAWRSNGRWVIPHQTTRHSPTRAREPESLRLYQRDPRYLKLPRSISPEQARFTTVVELTQSGLSKGKAMQPSFSHHSGDTPNAHPTCPHEIFPYAWGGPVPGQSRSPRITCTCTTRVPLPPRCPSLRCASHVSTPPWAGPPGYRQQVHPFPVVSMD